MIGGNEGNVAGACRDPLSVQFDGGGELHGIISTQAMPFGEGSGG